jgi:capsular polysaccharide biosynthesis protein
MSVYTLEDVFVNHEALIFRRGRIYPESFVAPMYRARYKRESRPGAFLLKNYWLRRGAVTMPSGLWAIDNFSPDNYHHWLVDVLPRLLLAEELYPDERVLLLPRYYARQPYIPFTLQAFSRIDRIGWIGARAKTRVQRLAFVPRPPVFLRDLLGEVANRVGSLAGAPSDARRIYFSRTDAPRRRARNEKELIRVLRSYDFEIIRIDPAKPWEQVRASLGANLIAGVHGAALTNLIFMQPGGRLLELRHGQNEVFFKAYGPLAKAMGIHYRAQICELAHEAIGYEINNADLIVDLDLFRENLSQLAVG